MRRYKRIRAYASVETLTTYKQLTSNKHVITSTNYYTVIILIFTKSCPYTEIDTISHSSSFLDHFIVESIRRMGVDGYKEKSPLTLCDQL